MFYATSLVNGFIVHVKFLSKNDFFFDKKKYDISITQDWIIIDINNERGAMHLIFSLITFFII